MTISVVIPAFNEQRRLPATLQQVVPYLAGRFAEYEVIVVDDGSGDDTAGVVAAAGSGRVRLIRYAPNRGKGHAVRTGVLAATGEFILVSDADLSTPIEELETLLQALDGCDVAIGSRATAQTRILRYQPWYRIVLGKTFNKIVRLLAVGGLNDTQCGFKCWRAAAARAVFSRSLIDGFAFDVETLFLARRMGFSIREVGVAWRNDPESKVHPLFHSAQMLKDLLKIRTLALCGRYRADRPQKPRP